MIGKRFSIPLQDNEIRIIDNEVTGEFHLIENNAPNTRAKYAEAANWCTETQKGTIKLFSEGEGDNKVEWYEVVPLLKPEPTAKEKAQSIRSDRDRRIDETTWLVERHHEQTECVMTKSAESTTLTNEQYRELLSYRQALRDVPEQPTFPDSVEWPEKPSFIK